MTLFFVILIIVASLLLGLVVLVQNPKGGGLAGNIGGFSNQFMGVKQTTDVLEKGTWIFGGLIALLCLFSVVFISNSASNGAEDRLKQATGAPTKTVNKNNTNNTSGTGLPQQNNTTTPPSNTPLGKP